MASTIVNKQGKVTYGDFASMSTEERIYDFVKYGTPRQEGDSEIENRANWMREIIADAQLVAIHAILQKHSNGYVDAEDIKKIEAEIEAIKAKAQEKKDWREGLKPAW